MKSSKDINFRYLNTIEPKQMEMYIETIEHGRHQMLGRSLTRVSTYWPNIGLILPKRPKRAQCFIPMVKGR
ncbi:MAG: hypothetical protein CFH10_00658 [Alphaproteobacteria bacterium MarineAlpha4_Bin2]|nr:MAG: hypothetical protein CFH10_00658 [Alphaproteobacteria bacterium MarineAlpha4_Bin2]